MTVRGHLEFGEAMSMFRQNAEHKREALRDWERLIQQAAQADIDHARAYARAIVEADGPVTVKEALAKSETVELRAKRDVLNDMKKVLQERCRMLEGERANLNGLVDWSKRLDPSVGG